MADLGEEAFSSQMKVVATFLRLLEELMVCCLGHERLPERRYRLLWGKRLRYVPRLLHQH